MGLGNAWAENLRRKSLCQGTEQIDPFSNEASILIHKSCLSGINKNRIKAGTSLSLASTEQKGSLPGAQQRGKHYFHPTRHVFVPFSTFPVVFVLYIINIGC